MWTCHEIDQFASCAKWSGAEYFQFWIDLILFDWVALTEVNDSFDIFFLLLPPVITVSICNAEFISLLSVGRLHHPVGGEFCIQLWR